jgi:hypothetical protein
MHRTALLLVTLLAAAPLSAAQAPAGAPPPPAGFVRAVKVTTDKAPDCSSLASIVSSVTRGAETDDQKAIAIYNFMRLTHYHHACPQEPGGIGALKLINVYGWALCGSLHTTQAALWREAGWPWRYVGWSDPGHTTVEVQYGGRWHYLDVFLKLYAWRPDPAAPGGRTIAGQDDIRADPALLTEGLVFDNARQVWYARGNAFEMTGKTANWTAPAFLVCGDGVPGALSGIRSAKGAGSPTGWASVKFDDPAYSTDVNLAPGYSLTLLWHAVEGAHRTGWNRPNPPAHSCGDKGIRNSPESGPVLEPYLATEGRGRSFANGTLRWSPDLAGPAALDALAARDNVRVDASARRLVPTDAARPGSVTVLLASPYVMTRARGTAEGADSVEVSTDGGKTFARADLADFSAAVAGKYACLVRLGFAKALAAPVLEITVQHNRSALPYLAPGRNTITVSAADAAALGNGRLVVTYAWNPGSQGLSYEDLCAQGAEIARAHGSRWSETPTFVRKTFAAADLPATFTIDIPTPPGKRPAYPRMLMLSREVLAEGAAPLPLPDGAVEAVEAPADQLITLPSPLHTGFTAPAPQAPRKTAVTRLPLVPGPVVSMKGEVHARHFLKWQKDSSDAWILLVGGRLDGLPPADAIARVRLVAPVVRGYEKAPTRVAAVWLKAPFEAGKPYDFAGLGETLGSDTVPASPDADFAPPRLVALDVTAAVRRAATGQAAFHGFAVRTVPDRSVDDGWTVRVDLAPDAPPYLEVETWAADAP